MEIQQKIRYKVCILYLSGRINYKEEASRQIINKFEAAIKDGHKTIIIDLEQVTYMDSSGLGALIKCLKDIEEVKADSE